ncbi:formylglycine-generating enzyme family protein [Psychrobacter pygoscelis]|uniref:formylglycine-generating enzyme family protein n=1 Tax=Psychrobacter pygoscelis TaxID=2488563 RepID=UPI001A955CE3|nr:formylglycine-generating enzyme family protein [Psychrobacter pygoscelis]
MSATYHRLLYLMGLSLIVGMVTSVEAKLLPIDQGVYRPLYLSNNSPMVSVKPFYIDELPVTNAQFYRFVQKYPKCQKQTIAPIFADTGYLKHWQKTSKGFVPKREDLQKPVVNVSWYAANQYCRGLKKHLPTVEQWEYVAQASETHKNGSREAGYNQRILDWYAQTGGSQYEMNKVGQSPANYWGIKDMHGLIWEWTENFNNNLVTGESRSDSNLNQNLFCGSAAIGAVDPSDYAAFMRYGFRSSLEAKYTVSSLGFRCAVG